MSEIHSPDGIQEHLSSIVWAHTGRSTVGFVRVEDSAPTSLGSGTLIRFGSIVGVLTCAHVLEELPDDEDIGILCFPVRAAQVRSVILSPGFPGRAARDLSPPAFQRSGRC